jgi:hypothetical protein
MSFKYFGAVIVNVVIYQISVMHWWYHLQKLSINLSNSLALMICNKSLQYPLICCKKYGVSDIVNFNETDLDRMKWLGFNLNCLIGTPIHLLFGCFIAFYYVGYAFLPAIGFIFLTGFVTAVLA